MVNICLLFLLIVIRMEGGADESAWGVLFYFSYNDGVEVYTTYKPRYRGHPIRPVID